MVDSPEFLIIQITIFHFYQKSLITEKKNNQRFDIPTQLFSSYLRETIHLFGLIYYIGDECKSGHYFAKKLTFENIVETYDDSGCYLNPIENTFPSKNAYIIFFQKSSSYI